MKIRKSHTEDISEISRIIGAAREFMRANGNPSQWSDGYPSDETIVGDINRGVCYLIEHNGTAVATFSFAVGEDTTYGVIDGQWLNDLPYGTIHRLASDGSCKGIADVCLDFCLSICRNIRVDTHADNIIMMKWLLARGFSYCGTIVVEDGSQRMAFQSLSE